MDAVIIRGTDYSPWWTGNWKFSWIRPWYIIFLPCSACQKTEPPIPIRTFRADLNRKKLQIQKKTDKNGGISPGLNKVTYFFARISATWVRAPLKLLHQLSASLAYPMCRFLKAAWYVQCASATTDFLISQTISAMISGTHFVSQFFGNMHHAGECFIFS